MPDHVTISPALPDEAEAIYQLICELADYEKLRHEMVATPESLKVTLFGPERSAECWLARVEGTAVGMAIFFTNYSTFLGRPGLYLEDLYVQPAYRGRGIGKRLLQSLAQVCVDRNYGRMEWSVLDWNQPSIDFYRSLGAVPMEEWTTFRLTGDALKSAGDIEPG